MGCWTLYYGLNLIIITSEFDSISSSILECNNCKMLFETWSLYWSECLRIFLHLKYALVCSLYARKYVHCSSFRQIKLECSSHELCVSYLEYNKQFLCYDFYRNPGHDGSLYDWLLDSMARVLSVDDKAVFVFVGDANAHHSEWLESVSPTDRQGSDALEFCNLSDCEQLVRCPTHIAGNRLDLVMDGCPWRSGWVCLYSTGNFWSRFVSCVLLVEQSVLKYNIRSTVFLKHRTNWVNVRCAVRRFTSSIILKPAGPIDALDRAIGEVIGRLAPTTVLRSRSGDKQWFDASCQNCLSRLAIPDREN